MGSIGDAYDNMLYESIFATFECELIERRSVRNQEKAMIALFDSVGVLYSLHG